MNTRIDTLTIKGAATCVWLAREAEIHALCMKHNRIVRSIGSYRSITEVSAIHIGASSARVLVNMSATRKLTGIIHSTWFTRINRLIGGSQPEMLALFMKPTPKYR